MSEEEGHEFLAPYFTNLKLIGTGGSGAVYSAIDRETDRRVALKRVNIQDQSGCRTALRQFVVQTNLEHENVVKLLKIVDSEGKAIYHEAAENFKDAKYVYLVQELAETNLHTILQCHSNLEEDYTKLFLYQLLRGIKYIHSANVLHRDIKPSNLLVDSETLMLKIGDFGQTRIVDPDFDHQGLLTHSPSTLWYKAPELLLTPTRYSSALDMWGVGCVFAEMLLGKPLFEGRHELEQLELILDSIAVEEREFKNIDSDFTENVRKIVSDGPQAPLSSRFPDLNENALDLLTKMLKFSPENRMTVEEALAHPYLEIYSFPSDEPFALAPLYIENEVDDFPEEILHDMLYTEITKWHTVSSPMSNSTDEEQPDSMEKDIMSLKELMSCQDEPLTLQKSYSGGSYHENDFMKYKLHPEVKDALGIQSSREGLETFAAAVKISRTFHDGSSNQEEPAKNGKPQHQHAGISEVMESILGKEYKKNFDFSCKAGPLGLCYL